MSIQGLVDINDFNDPKTIDLFETVIEMFTYPCDVDFERDSSTERPPVEPEDKLGVIGFAMDPHLIRCTYTASQTQVCTHAPHTRAAHTRAHAHTQRTCMHAHARARRRTTWAFRRTTQQASTIAVSSTRKSY